MLNTDQRKSRLEDLLERVLKNKDRTGAAAVATPAKPAVAARPAPTAAVAKPAVAVAAAPAPEAARPKPKPLVAPLIEPPTPPEPMAAHTEDDDIDFGFAASFQTNPPAEPAPAEEVAAPPAPQPASIPTPVTPAAASPRTFPSAPEASGPVVGVVGDRPEDWTVAAVLQRAWQFGAN